MNKIAVLVPYFGGLDYEHLQCMNRLKAIPQEVTPITTIELPNCPWIDMAQAYLVDRALQDPEVDILFFIEHDMLFDAQDVLKMAERCRGSKYDVLGAAYSQRRPGGFVVGGITEPVAEFYSDKLYDATHCGLGFTAVKRSVFEELRCVIPAVYCPAVDAKIHPYFAHIIDEMYYGQDASFFRRISEFGCKIGIDAQPRVFHRGLYNYALEDTGIKVPRYERLTIQNPNYTTAKPKEGGA